MANNHTEKNFHEWCVRTSFAEIKDIINNEEWESKFSISYD
jgi:hypothetical protein